MPTFRLFQVDSFTSQRFRGNPAGVIPEAEGLSDPEMQAIARELNNPETAFILPPDAPDHDMRVRFFTPTREVPSCGHATIAAHFVRAVEGSLPPGRVVQKTGAGRLPVDLERDPQGYTVVMTQAPPRFGQPLGKELVEEIAAALGAPAGSLAPGLPIQVVDTGHSKVLIPVRTRAELAWLAPDLAALVALSRALACNGFFPFTLDSQERDTLAHSRMFAPAIGIPEDPVTGNGNGPLGAYLAHHGLLELRGGERRFLARQGDEVGRPGVVEVRVKGEGRIVNQVQVAGRAVVAFRTEIEV